MTPPIFPTGANRASCAAAADVESRAEGLGVYEDAYQPVNKLARNIGKLQGILLPYLQLHSSLEDGAKPRS